MKVLPPRSHLDCCRPPPRKQRRLLQREEKATTSESPSVSLSSRSSATAVNIQDVFDQCIGPVMSSGYLRWHDAIHLSQVTKTCRAVWKEQEETYADFQALLDELNSMNCTNRCTRCQKPIALKSYRNCCQSTEQWKRQSAERTPDFHGALDLVMTTGFLTWREMGGVRRISKKSYKVYKEQCTCALEDRTTLMVPFIPHDPRFNDDYKHWSIRKQSQEMVRYTAFLTRNLHSFYDFERLADPQYLPNGLGGGSWLDLQMLSLQRVCPRRYTFVMNAVSLFMAQGELSRSIPYWYANAFLGISHDPVAGSAFEEHLGSGISEFCLPATDEVLCRFLQTKCYPTEESQDVLGPLVHKLSVFAPYFKMVPLVQDISHHFPFSPAFRPYASKQVDNENHHNSSETTTGNSCSKEESKSMIRMPKDLEVLDDEMISSMSFHFFCTIS